MPLCRHGAGFARFTFRSSIHFCNILFQLTDQSAVVDLRNENQQLRNQIDRLKYERKWPFFLFCFDFLKHSLLLFLHYNSGGKVQQGLGGGSWRKRETAAAGGEFEIGALTSRRAFRKQLRNDGVLCAAQMEAKEAAWRAEMETRLSEERHDAERRLAEIALRHGVEWRAAEASRNDERLRWQRTVDELAQSAKDALAEKERLEKNIRLEVENQVQVLRDSVLQSF